MADPHLHEIRAGAGRPVPEGQEKVKGLGRFPKSKSGAFTQCGYLIAMLDNELKQSGRLNTNTLYHVEVQPDWNETNEDNLGYIKNKPDVMNMTVSNGTANFYYV